MTKRDMPHEKNTDVNFMQENLIKCSARMIKRGGGILARSITSV